MLKLDEPFTLVIEKEITDIMESLSGQELRLGVGVVGIDETSRLDLNLLEVNTVRTNGQSEPLSVTGEVVAVGGLETPELRRVLLEEGVLTCSEDCSEADSCDDDWTKSCLDLTVKAYSTPTPASPSLMSFVKRSFP